MDIVERLALKVRDGNYELGDHPAVMEAEDTMMDARDEITLLRAEVDRLREVLGFYAGGAAADGTLWEPLNDRGNLAHAALHHPRQDVQKEGGGTKFLWDFDTTRITRDGTRDD